MHARCLEVEMLGPARVRITFEASPPLKRYAREIDLYAAVHAPAQRPLPAEVGPKNVTPSPATHAILIQLKAGDLIHRV